MGSDRGSKKSSSQKTAGLIFSAHSWTRTSTSRALAMKLLTLFFAPGTRRRRADVARGKNYPDLESGSHGEEETGRGAGFETRKIRPRSLRQRNVVTTVGLRSLPQRNVVTPLSLGSLRQRNVAATWGLRSLRQRNVATALGSRRGLQTRVPGGGGLRR